MRSEPRAKEPVSSDSLPACLHPHPPTASWAPPMGMAELEGADAGEGQFLGPTMKAQQAKTLRTGPRSSP